MDSRFHQTFAKYAILIWRGAIFQSGSSWVYENALESSSTHNLRRLHSKKEIKSAFEFLRMHREKSIEPLGCRNSRIRRIGMEKAYPVGTIQHYEGRESHLLDLTHSLRVACSFAQIEANDKHGYVYVFGLPYITNQVTHNSEHDIANVRWLEQLPTGRSTSVFSRRYLGGTEILRMIDDNGKLDFRTHLLPWFIFKASQVLGNRFLKNRQMC